MGGKAIKMKNTVELVGFLVGLGTGVALMYFLDPEKGRRRRTLMRDKAVALSNDASEAIDKTSRDLSNRAYGVMAEATQAVTGKPIDETAGAER